MGLESWLAENTIEGKPLIPASTVVPLRDSVEGLEVLMIKRNTKLSFAEGMWVFPGGKIDEIDKVFDSTGNLDELPPAVNAAVRATFEESSISVALENLVWFSHLVPPPITPKRFSTYFFATDYSDDDQVVIDDSEIIEHKWFRPGEAIALRDKGKIELAPPTWMTLNLLCLFTSVESALSELKNREPLFYETRIGQSEKGPVAMWFGDAGYENGNPEIAGDRHRLTMSENGYHFAQSTT